MPVNKILTIVNTSHAVGSPRSLIIEGTDGTPSIKLNKLSSVSIDYYEAQLDEKFSDTLYDYVQRGWVKVLLDGVEVLQDEVGNIKYTIPAGSPEPVPVEATQVSVSSSGFSGILSPADTNVQLALNTIDTHTHGGSSGIIEERGILTVDGGIVYTPTTGGVSAVVRDP